MSSATGDDISAGRIESNGHATAGWPEAIGGSPVTRAVGGQYQNDIASDGAGGAFVTWRDYRDALSNFIDVYAQHIMANGQIAAGWPADGLPISTGPGEQDFGLLLADGAGGVFVSWTNGPSAFLQHLAGNGSSTAGWPVGGIKLVDLPSAPQLIVSPASLVPDGYGGCLAVWADDRSGKRDLYVQRLTWSGALAAGWPANGKRIVDSDPAMRYSYIGGAVPDGAGGCFVGFSIFDDPDALDDDIYAQHVLADGTIDPAWSTRGLAVCALVDWQSLTSVSADSTGGVLIAWYDDRVRPAKAYAQRLRPDGTPAPGWQPNGNLVSTLGGYHYKPLLAPDGRGGAFVCFEDASGGQSYVQRLLPNGSRGTGWPSTGIPLVDPTIPNTSQIDLAIAPDGVGGAVVVWNDYRNGIQYQIYAQRYSGDDITATQVALVNFEALPDRVRLTWTRGAAEHFDVEVERRTGSGDWQAIDQASFDGTGRLEYVDHSVTPGTRVGYRLSWVENSVTEHSTESVIEVPVAIALALEGLRPNPAVGDLQVAFSLPRAGDTTLEVVDIGGRVVARRELDGLGAGRHLVRVNEGARLHPGVYWLRLTHDGERLLARGVVLR